MLTHEHGESNRQGEAATEEETILAVEHAWMKLRQEMDEMHRRNEVLSETIHYLQEKAANQEVQLKEAQRLQKHAEERLKEETKQREQLAFENEQLQERLTKAVHLIAEERSRGWFNKLLKR